MNCWNCDCHNLNNTNFYGAIFLTYRLASLSDLPNMLTRKNILIRTEWGLLSQPSDRAVTWTTRPKDIKIMLTLYLNLEAHLKNSDDARTWSISLLIITITSKSFRGIKNNSKGWIYMYIYIWEASYKHFVCVEWTYLLCSLTAWYANSTNFQLCIKVPYLNDAEQAAPIVLYCLKLWSLFLLVSVCVLVMVFSNNAGLVAVCLYGLLQAWKLEKDQSEKRLRQKIAGRNRQVFFISCGTALDRQPKKQFLTKTKAIIS